MPLVPWTLVRIATATANCGWWLHIPRGTICFVWPLLGRAARSLEGRSARPWHTAPDALALFRRVGEFLSGNSCLIHQAALGNREHRHALLVVARGRRVLLAAARTRGRAAGAGACRGARGNGDRADVSAEGESAGGEFIERPLILEEDDLAVGLAARLQTDAQLRHRCVADVLALLVDLARAVGRADQESALADRRKNHIAVAGAEKCGACARILEQTDGVAVAVGQRRESRERQRRDQQAGRPDFIHFKLSQ